ncbi:MAG TPA: tetratricopeptide repeat protein [bacterium]|nr:tetratricopeptide repeat protein [bacterium]
MKYLQLFFMLLLLVGCATMKQAHQLFDQGNYQAAINECRRAIEADSLNAEAYLILGKSHRALGQYDLAVRNLSRAYHITPVSKITNQAKDELAAIHLQLGDDALAEKNYHQALTEYRITLELDSTNYRANFQLAVAYQQNHWLDKADYYFKKAASAGFDEQEVAARLAQIDSLTQLANEHFERGKQFYLRKSYVSAARELERATMLKQDHSDANYFYHIATGKTLYRKGGKSNLWDAIEHFGKAMMIRFDSAEPHFFMAQAYEKKDGNEFDNAISEYQLALEKEPAGPLANSCRKKIRVLTGRRDKMKQFWGK